MSQLVLGEEPEEARPELGDRSAEALAGIILGFAAPGRFAGGAKVPPKVQARANVIAKAAVRLAREALDG